MHFRPFLKLNCGIHGMVLHAMVLCGMVWYGIVWYGMVYMVCVYTLCNVYMSIKVIGPGKNRYYTLDVESI